MNQKIELINQLGFLEQFNNNLNSDHLKLYSKPESKKLKEKLNMNKEICDHSLVKGKFSQLNTYGKLKDQILRVNSSDLIYEDKFFADTHKKSEVLNESQSQYQYRFNGSQISCTLIKNEENRKALDDKVFRSNESSEITQINSSKNIQQIYQQKLYESIYRKEIFDLRCFHYNFALKLGQQSINLRLSQAQRNNLLNLLSQNKQIQFTNKIMNLAHQQIDSNLLKNAIESKDCQNVKYFHNLNIEVQNQISSKKKQVKQKNNRQLSLQRINMLDFERYSLPQNQSNIQNTQQFVNKFCQYVNLNNQQSNSSSNDLERLLINEQIKLNEMKLQSPQLLQNHKIKWENMGSQIVRKTQDKLLGGGGICGSKEAAYSSAPVQVRQQQELKEKVTQFANEIAQQQVSQKIEKIKVEQKQIKGEEILRFNQSYNHYFIVNKLHQYSLEDEVKYVIKRILFPLNDYVGSYELKEKVIDIMNQLMNLLILIIMRKTQNSSEKKIIKLSTKLQKLRTCCEESNERFACLDIYQYCDMLINLNNQRLRMDEVNFGSNSDSIVQRMALLIKYGAGFVSVSKAFMNISEEDVIEINKEIIQIKLINSQISSESLNQQGVNSILDYNTNIMSKNIYALYLKKAKKLGDRFYYKNEIEEIIFYLEEAQNLKSSETLLFVYLQQKYLLYKQKKTDNFKGLIQRLDKENKLDLIVQQANYLSIKESTDLPIDKLKIIANLTAQYDQFRQIKAELLLNFAEILKLTNKNEKQFQSLMNTIASNYFLEKQNSVKVAYEENQILLDYINKSIDNIKILNEINAYKQQMIRHLDHQQQFHQFSLVITNEKELNVQLTKFSIVSWLQSVKLKYRDLQIIQKDEQLVEVNDFYISQQLSYQEGYKINTDDKDAVKQIIDQFLIPNFVSNEQEIHQQQQFNQLDIKNKTVINSQLLNLNLQDQLNQQQINQVNFKTPCKVVSILGEGGSGKSILLKKMEVELLYRKTDYTKDKRSNYIPLIIKCSSLDRQNPSIELYLEQVNLSSKFIEILKNSERNKLIMLDGFDEYSGEYFKVFQKLRLNEWKNTIALITSRSDKINLQDASVYFNSYDLYGSQMSKDSFSILNLEKFTESDIFEYFSVFLKNNQQEQQSILQQFEKMKEIIYRFAELIQVLKLPINLYYLTRMISDLNLYDESTYYSFQDISDYVQILELFFSRHFYNQSYFFILQQRYLHLNDHQSQELIEIVQQSFFEYFQQIAMQMLLQKGQKSDYLSITLSEIQFQPREEITACLQRYQIKTEDLIRLLNSYADPRVEKVSYHSENKEKTLQIQMVKVVEGQNKQFEFRFKSLFEYFAARAMKYDFDLHRENIFSMKIQQLKSFNINKTLIVDIESNLSEQIILKYLYRLLKSDLDQFSFRQTYSKQKISETNRYIQYLKRSTINLHAEKSLIDVGASNLLSALFISKFLFPHLVLQKCSFSQAYLSPYKSIKFQDCNLTNTFISQSNLENCETSNTKNAVYGAFKKYFDSKDIYQFNRVIFYKKTLIALTRSGFINQFQINENNNQEWKMLKSNQITTVALRSIHLMKSKNVFIVRGRRSIFEIDCETLEKTNSYTFNSIISNISLNDQKCIVTLENYQIYFGDIQNGFNQLNPNYIQAEQSLQINDQVITYQYGNINVYNLQSLQLLQTIPNYPVDFNVSSFSPDGKYLITAGTKDCTFKVWNVQNSLQLVNTIQGHTEPVYSVSFSTNGKYLATAARDQTCKIWNVERGFELIKVTEGHSQNIISVAFSEDDRYLATSSFDNTCKIWSIEKAFELVNTIRSYAQSVISVAFSPDRHYLATSSLDNTCKIWNISNGFSLIKIIDKEQSHLINSLAFSADGKYLATGSQDSICKIWDVHNGFQLINTIQGHVSPITSVAFSQDGKYLATGSVDMTCKIWSAEKGFSLINSIQGHTLEIRSVAFSPDSKYIATASCDNTCQIWNIEKGFYLLNNIQGHTQTINSVAFSSDGKYLATGSEDKTCKIWNPYKRGEPIKIIQGHTSKINSVSFSSNGKYLATASEDKTTKIWNVEKQFELTNTIDGHPSGIFSVCFSVDSKYIATGSADKTCKIWYSEKIYELKNDNLQSGHTESINQIVISADNKYLASCSDDKTCKIWDLLKGFQLAKTIIGHSEKINSVSFSIDGKYLATGSSDSTCKVWNVQKGFELLHTIEGQIHHITAVAFSYDGKYLAIGSYMTCHIWSVQKGFELENTIKGNSSKINSVAFSFDNKYLATGSEDNTVKIWMVQKEFELLNTTQRHSSFVKSVAFSPDGRYLASGSQDLTCKIWNVQRGFELLVTIQGHAFEINQVAFSPDSKYLATCSYDKTCKIWNADQGFYLVNSFQADTWSISSLAFSADGSYLATTSRDKTCKIWNFQYGLYLMNQFQNYQFNFYAQTDAIQNQKNLLRFLGTDRIYEQEYEF